MAKSSASARSQISRFSQVFLRNGKAYCSWSHKKKEKKKKKEKENLSHLCKTLCIKSYIILPLSESMQKWLPQSFFNITFILGKCIFKKLFIFHSMSGCYIVLVKIKLLYKLLCTFACITFSYKCCEVGFSQVLGIFFLNITLHFLLALSQILRHKISCWCNLNNFLIEVLHFRRKII